MRFRALSIVSIASVLLAVLAAAPGVAAAAVEDSFIDPADVVALQARHLDLVLIDARKPGDYAKGHLPGAINLPPQKWRTPKVKIGEGRSQYIFRNDDGSPDIARYEQMLGDAGITRETPVVVYGNHAGKSDGSVPAMILDMLGQERVWFLDGVGARRWADAGYVLSTRPAAERNPTRYHAQPKNGVVWTLNTVISHLGDDDVLFYDTRSPAEYHGTDDRPNARKGRIPGAVLCNYEKMLTDDKTTVSSEKAKALLEERGITPDKTVVLYCQTATRVSLPYLMLKDLGYEDVRVYDASWFEYGNTPGTPIETDERVENRTE